MRCHGTQRNVTYVIHESLRETQIRVTQIISNDF